MMTKLTPELWEEVRGHLAHCLELSDGERGVYLYELGRGGEAGRAVKAEVEALLADCPTENFLAQSPESAADGDADPPARIGYYAIQREIGRGGMGTVYHAIRDDNEYQAEVAIKVLRGGLTTGFFARRFRFERQLLAYLNHGSIVRLLDGGTTEDGRPFLATEYVVGEPLLAWCRERRLGVAARLRLFLPVCDAVHHAHQNLIIHCDLKPGNVMVNRQGVPKLLDFGIARLLMPTPVAGDMTEAGMRLMTLPYASPEQVRGERVTTATDVYSLGCTLFELLTGAPPFAKVRPVESLEADPPVASLRVKAGMPVARAELRGDIDNVLRKAMDPVPARRYESAEQLAADLRRILDHEPVLARPLTRRYQLQKFLRRNRPLAIGLGAAIAALAVGAGVSLHQWRVAAAERDQARRLYDNAHRLAYSFVFEVDDALIKSGPTGARKLIVEQGLASLDRLAAEPAAGGSKVRRELPAAYIKLGDVLGRQGAANVGRTADAQRSYERGLAIANELLKSEPGNGELWRIAATANTRLAGVLKIQGRYREALARGLAACAILTERSRVPGATLSDLRALAAAYQDVGGSFAHLGQWAQSGSIRRQALRLLQDVSATPGATPEDRAATVLGRIRLASILTREKKYAEAAAETALAAGEARALNRPDLVSSALHTDGLNLRSQKRWAEALGQQRESHRLRLERAAADPSDWRMKSLAAASLLRVGEAEVALGQWNAGINDLERVLAIRLQLSEADPANSGAQAELGEVHDLLGDAWHLRSRVRARDHWGRARRVFEPLATRGLLGHIQLEQLAALKHKLDPQ